MCTKEELFKENYKLAYWLVINKFPMLADDDDAKQEALIGLWKACCVYDPSKGRFAAFASRCIMNEVLMYIRKTASNNRLVSAHLEDPLPGYETITVADAIEDPNWDTEFNRVALEEAMKDLTPKERALISLRSSGMTQRELAKRLGISQPYASRLLKKAMMRLGV